jgi:putative endonuclease
MKQHYVYVLFSKRCQRTYVGETASPEQRLKQHNAGKVRSTKAFAPWERIILECHETRILALERERWLKTRAGRDYLRTIMAAL